MVKKNLNFVLMTFLLITILVGFVGAAISDISVTSPDGGEQWSGTQDITWDAPGCDNETLWIFWGKGGSIETPHTQAAITKDVDCSAGSYGWDTSGREDGSDYQIKICTPSDYCNTYDYSNDFFTIDNSAPTTTKTIESGTQGENEWYISDVSITLSCSDEGPSGCENTYYTINDGSEQTYDSEIIVSEEGTNELEYWSVDNAGNVEEHNTATIKIDKTSPETTLSMDSSYEDGEGNTYVTSSTQFTLDASDSDSGVQTTEYKIDSGNWNDYSDGFTLSGDGSHTIEYRSTDKAGNTETENSKTVYVDDTSPSVTNLNVNPSYSNSENYISGTSDITADVSDSDSGVASCEYTLDGGSSWENANYDSSNGDCTVSNVDTISATSINMRASDNLGNRGSGSSLSVTPDTTNPTTELLIGSPIYQDDKTHVTSSTQFTLSADDSSGSGVQTTEYKIDSGSWNDYNSGFTLSEGEHTIEYKSTDKVGNEETENSKTVYVDNTSPSVSVTNPPANWIVNKNGVIPSASCSDDDRDVDSGCDGSTVKYLKQDSDSDCSTNYDDYSSSVTVENHAYVCAAAKDNLGNVGFSSPVEFKVEDKIQDAVDAASSGDTISVGAGTYEENLTIETDNLNLTSEEGKDTTKIIGKINVKANDLIFEGFHVDYSSSEGAPVDIIQANGLTIRNNRIEGGKDTGGISTWTGPAIVQGDIVIEENEVIGGPIGLILGDNNANVKIRDNLIEEAGDEGIWIWQNSQGDLIIKDNNVSQAGLEEVKIVDKPLSINNKTTTFEMKDAILEENSGISTVLLEWIKDVHNVNKDAFYETIQGAVDAASSGDTINVSSGTYTENIVIDKSLTILGPNAGISAVDGNRVEEAVINTPSDKAEAITLNQADLGTISVDGFTVNGGTEGGIIQHYSNSEGTTFNVLNNIVNVPESGWSAHGNSIEVCGSESTVIGNDVQLTGYDEEQPDWSTSGILAFKGSNMLIKDNNIEYLDKNSIGTHSTGIAVAVFWASTPGANNDIRSNIIEGAEAGIDVQGNVENTIIEENIVKNNNVGIKSSNYGSSYGGVPSGTEIHNNEIFNNGMGVKSYAEGDLTSEQVNATHNWWGHITGPSGEGSGDGDTVSDNVDFDPWFVTEQGDIDTERPTSEITLDGTIYKDTGLFDLPYTASDDYGLKEIVLYKNDGHHTSYSIDNYPNETSGDLEVNLDDGAYEFYTKAVDVAENEEDAPTSADVTIVVDTTKPDVTIDSIDSPTNQSTITVTGTFSDTNIDSITIDGEEASLDESGGTYSAEVSLSEGSNTIVVEATDKAGNTNSAQAGVVLDTQAPSIIDDYSNDGTWVNSDQTVTLNPTDNGSGIKEVKYCEGDDCDPSNGNTLSSSYELDYTSSQNTIVRYQAWDNAGNPSDIGEYNVKIDKEAPSITDDYSNDGTWVNSDQTVELTPSDTGDSGIKEIKYCTGSGCTPSDVLDSPYELTYTTTQNTIVRYQAWDNAGNPSDIGDFNLTLDTQAPAIEDFSKDIAVEAGESMRLWASISEDGSGVDYVELSGNFTNETETMTPNSTTGIYEFISDSSPLESMTLTYNIKAIDKAGNTNITDNYTITIHDMVWDLTSESGWNLVSVPREVEDNSSVPENEMWYYNSSASDPFKRPESIEPGKGYWVREGSVEELGLNYKEKEYIETPGLYADLESIGEGWNLIGLTTEEPKTVEEVFKSKFTHKWSKDLLFAVSYDENTDKFIDIGPNDTMTPGKGYWVYIDSEN